MVTPWLWTFLIYNNKNQHIYVFIYSPRTWQNNKISPERGNYWPYLPRIKLLCEFGVSFMVISVLEVVFNLRLLLGLHLSLHTAADGTVTSFQCYCTKLDIHFHVTRYLFCARKPLLFPKWKKNKKKQPRFSSSLHQLSIWPSSMGRIKISTCWCAEICAETRKRQMWNFINFQTFASGFRARSQHKTIIYHGAD